MPKARTSVTEVIVIDTAESFSICSTRPSVDMVTLVKRHDDTSMYTSSRPIPVRANNAYLDSLCVLKAVTSVKH